MSSNILNSIQPEESGEPSYASGDPGDDMDIDGPELPVIAPEMQKQDTATEKIRKYPFVEDESVQFPRNRVLGLIPKPNLRIPFNWFDSDADIETFVKAAARETDVSVRHLSKANVATQLCLFLDVVLKHAALHKEKEGDPPGMSLEERRNRHWQAVIEESPLARYLSPRLVRHVAFMLVGASRDFAKSKGIRVTSSELNGKIDKLLEWFEENDPTDVEAFERLQPERREIPKPRGQAGRKSARLANCRPGLEKGKRRISSRKRKYLARRSQPQPVEPQTVESPALLPSPRLHGRMELPVRLAEAKDQMELPVRLAEAKGGNSY